MTKQRSGRKRAIAAALACLGSAMVTIAPTGVANAETVEPIFTQYIEGSSNNKALEIANVTGAPIDLSDYAVERFSNGGVDPVAIPLAGSLADGDVFVVANTSVNAAIAAVTDLFSGSANWNGDDALVLRKISTDDVVDSIGRVGEDPGSAWAANGVSTQNDTLCRLDTTNGGDTDPFDEFDPSVAYESKGQDNTDGLGDVGCSLVQDGDLLFTQYIEGSSNNKAIEIANTTGVEIDLTDYAVERFSNGAATDPALIPLTGALADGDVFVIANTSANAAITDVADLLSGSANWNGDDALVLRKISTDEVVDSIGRVGEDPGSAWAANGVSTQNDTLCRLDSVTDGDTDPSDEFDPSAEWESQGEDNTDGLGELGCAGPPEASTLLFTQYIEGSSNNKAIEISNLGTNPVDLSTFDVERYSNGGATPAIIDLAGTVAPGGSFVLANTSANADILDVADQTSGNANWNGDDGLVLRDGDGNIVDSFGRLEEDPGSQWVGVIDPSVTTQNDTLCRNAGVTAGDTDFTDVFDPSVEWTAIGEDNTAGLGNPTCSPQAVGDLIITQYVEGSSNNKAIEIANFTGAELDLNNYAIEIYANGSLAPTSTIPGLGLAAEPIFDGDVYVVANSGASTAILAVANETSGSINWNGDDAIVLRNIETGAIIDSIGQVGVDPGSAWSANGVSTQNDTICRNASIGSTGGDTDPTDAFDPSVEYTSLGNDSIIGLGEVGCIDTSAGECGAGGISFIHEIQGSGSASPLDGQTVIIEGVVVADFQSGDLIGGFHVQEEDADADADPATSEGVSVFDGGFGIDVSVGDIVRVRGVVEEFFEMTQVGNLTDVEVCGDATGTATPFTLSLPHPVGFDFETIEGMAVEIPGPLVVTDTFNAARFGEVRVSINEPLVNPTQAAQPGAAANAVGELNDRSQVLLDDARSGSELFPASYFGSDNTLRRGDTFTGTLSTVLQYGFNAFRFQPTFDASVPDIFTRTDVRPAGPPDVGGDLSVASFNVLNYFLTLDERGADSEIERIRQRDKIVSAVTQMDAAVVGLIELENGGAALTDLVAGFNDATAPGTYAEITTGTIGTDAITVGFVYQPALVTPVGSPAILDGSVDPRFIDSKNRPILIQTFETNGGDVVTLAIGHLKSKGSPCDDVGDPNANDEQGNCNGTRTLAAEALVDFLATDPTGSGSDDFLIMGDINAYPNEDPITAFTDAGFVDLITQFHPDAQSFVFFGEGGRLDHALASPSLAASVTDANEWSINAAEPRGLDYNTAEDGDNPAELYVPDEFRSSDHDPVIVGLEFGPPQALMIVGSIDGQGRPPFRDRQFLAIAESLGLDVELVDDDDATAADAGDKDLVLLSSSVAPFKVRDEFTEVTVPLVSWEGFLFDDLGFNRSGNRRNGETTTTQSTFEIVDSSHPLSAGFDGVQTVATSNTKFSFSQPEGDPIVVGELGNDAVLFGFESGSAMAAESVAPARRVGFFASYFTGGRLNDVGEDLFVAAVGWALGSGTGPANAAPVVDAGDDQSVSSIDPVTVFLDATVDDDGRPVPPGTVTTLWSSTDGAVTFGDASDVDTTVDLPGPGTYQLTLTADDSELQTSDSVTVTVVGDVPTGTQIAYVAGSTAPPGGDVAIVDHLEATGADVTIFGDDTVGLEDFSEFDLIFLSTSVEIGKVGDAFRDDEIPVITNEQFLLRAMDMATGAGAALTRNITIVEPASSLAGGFTGTVRITDASVRTGTAQPAPSATVVAEVGGAPAYFAYDAGDTMVDAYVAPAPRVFFPGTYRTGFSARAEFFTLLDAAIVFALDA